MKKWPLIPAILMASCLDNPNSVPVISPAQIENLKMELRLGTYAGFRLNHADTLPKHIRSGDSATKAIFANEQVNAWLLISGIPKGIKMTEIVSATFIRNGERTEHPVYAKSVMNTCCIDDDDWNGETIHQMQFPFWNRPESLPFSIKYEVRVQGMLTLTDSITIE